MTLKDKAKTYNFWISLVSAAVLIARIIGNKFNVFIDTTLIMDITTGLCSIFVILGILSAPKAANIINQTNIEHTKSTDNSQNSVQEDTFVENTEPLMDSIKIDTELIVEKQENSAILTEEENHEKTEENIQTITNEDLNKTQDLNNNLENNNLNSEFSLIEIIEKLKADIHKANKIIQDYSTKN